MKGKIRRSIAKVLLCLTLFGVFTDAHTRVMEVRADALTYSALYAIFEYVMAASGLAVTNKADNETLCDAFCDWLEKGGTTPQEQIQSELDLLGKVYAGARVKLDEYPTLKKLMFEFVDSFVKTSTPVNKASKSEALNNFGCGRDVNDTKDMAFKGIFNAYGYSYYPNDVNKGKSSNYKSFAYYYKKNGTFTTPSNSVHSGDIFVIYAYNISDSNFYKPYPLENYFYLNSNMEIREFYDNSKRQDLTAYVLIFDSQTKKYKCSAGNYSFSELPLSYQKITKSLCHIYPASNTLEQNVTSTQVISALDNIGGIYGNTELIAASVAGITEVIAGQTPLIDSIAQTLSALDTNTLTAEDINEIVTTSIADYSDILNSVQDNTEDTAVNTATTNSWLSKLYAMVQSLSISVSKIATDGSSALDLDDVTDQFKVVEGSGGSPDPDNEPPKITGIGAFVAVKLLQPVLQAFDVSLKNVTKWLSDLQDSIEQGTLQQIKAQEETTKAVNELMTQVEALPEVMPESVPLEIPETFPEMFPESIPLEIPEPLPQLFPESIPLTLPEPLPQLVPESIPLELPENFPESIPLEIPETFPEMFPESIPLTWPDSPLDIPILEDILSVLKQILEAVLSFFIVDTAAIELSMDKNKEKIGKKLPFDPAKKLFALFDFSDEYDYPILKIQSPDIIKQFTHEEYIILFNGENFAKYFKMVRTFLIGFFWVGYAYCIVCKFRVRFALD